MAFFAENDKAILFNSLQKSTTRNAFEDKPKKSKNGKQEDQTKPNHFRSPIEEQRK